MEKEKLVDMAKVQRIVKLLHSPKKIDKTVGKGTRAFRRARREFIQAPPSSKAETMALVNWIEKCSTIGELADAYQWTPIGSNAERITLNKIYDLI